MTTRTRVHDLRTRWSLARQLPLLTAAIVVVVLALSLTITYRALIDARSDTVHARMSGLLNTMALGSAATTKARVTLLRSVASDSAVHATVLHPDVALARGADSAVLRALERLAIPADSGLPIEIWTADGRRVASVGTDLRGDPMTVLKPELRSARGARMTDAPLSSTGADSVQFGQLYQSEGHVLFWNVVPVLDHGQRVGFITQQRRVNATPNLGKTLKDLSGENFNLYFRNRVGDFISSLDGRPVPQPLHRDTADGGYIVRRAGGVTNLGMERVIPGVPYVFVLESPRDAILEPTRATVQRIALISLVILVAGVTVAWLLSREITRPLAEMARAAEAIAHGNYARRVDTEHATSDEVLRLGSSFNRMAGEVEASQHELATQVEEAVAVSQALEDVNTQLQETSAEAEQARDAALRANQAKSDFLAVMSHELRTPLNAIGGYTDILQMGIYGDLSNEQKDALARIARSQQTLLLLINDVLNFAKLESGQIQFTISDVLVLDAVAALEPLIAPQLQSRGIHYEVHPCANDVLVRADVDKLQQILINLLSNAIKYSGDRARIDVSCEVLDDHVKIHVRDTGIGIAPDRIGTIFDPFIQVGRAFNRPHDGVGLGLSISRDLAEAMGGTLSVASVVGEGSTFTLTLERGRLGRH